MEDLRFVGDVHPSESAILAFLGEDVLPSARHAIERHVDACEECHDLVVVLAKSGGPAQPAASPLPRVGDLLVGRFRIETVLGVGATGVVFRALDTALGVAVAIKVFAPGRGHDRASLESVHREATFGRRLVHPHIRAVYDLGTHGDSTFLVMELIEGETLEARLLRGPVQLRDALSILDQICDAVSAAHAVGVIHRDLKPSNVAIDAAGRVVVMDFGLARQVDAPTATRGLVGTPLYWSPEQSRGERATEASDVYSLGLIAHYLLTGSPFSLSAPVPLPRPYRRVIRRSLAQQPRERYSSVYELRRALSTQAGSNWMRSPGLRVAAAGSTLA